MITSIRNSVIKISNRKFKISRRKADMIKAEAQLEYNKHIKHNPENSNDVYGPPKNNGRLKNVGFFESLLDKIVPQKILS